MARLLFLLLVAAGAGAYLVRLLEKRRRDRLAQVRAAFLASVPAARDHGPAQKDVALRNGAVRMRLPRHWAEEYPHEDRASFRDPGSPERVLRVASATAAGQADLRALLQSRAGRETVTIEDLSEARVLLRSVDAVREDGRDVVVFRWMAAAPLPSLLARVATFTLSVPEGTALDPLVRDVVAVLDLEIRAAQLA